MLKIIPQVKPFSLSKQTKTQKIASAIGQYIPDKLAKSFEMTQNGTIPRVSLVILSFIFVLGARFVKSRDAHERREVLTRDGITIGAAMLGVPVLKNLLARSISKISKLPIHDNNTKLFSLDDFGLDNVKNQYSKVNSMPKKVLTLAENIKQRGGDIKTAFEKLGDDGMKHITTILKGKECTSENILASLKEAANATNNFTKNDGYYKAACDSLNNLLSNPDNNLVKAAQRLKAIPALASLVGITAILGWGIPAFNIYFTRKKLNAKQNNEQKTIASNIEKEKISDVFQGNKNDTTSIQKQQIISSFLCKK